MFVVEFEMVFLKLRPATVCMTSYNYYGEMNNPDNRLSA